MTWIRIGLEYVHWKGTFTKLYCLNVKRLFPIFLLDVSLFKNYSY